MIGGAQGEINGAIGRGGGAKILQRGARVGRAMQNVVGDNGVVVAADEFAEGGLIDGAVFDAQVGESAAARGGERGRSEPF